MVDQSTIDADKTKLTADQAKLVADQEARNKVDAEARAKAMAAAQNPVPLGAGAVAVTAAPLGASPPPAAAAAGGAISHPSVAAIVPATPGGVAGPDQPTILIHAKRIGDEEMIPPVPIPPLEPVSKLIPQLGPDPLRPRREEVVIPVGQEQLARSEANEERGMHNWPMDHDDRLRPPPDAVITPRPPRAVPGVGFNPPPKGSA